MSFVGTAFSEPKLIKLTSGFEAATKARIKPQFLPTLPTDQAAPSRKGKGPKVTRPKPMAMRIWFRRQPSESSLGSPARVADAEPAGDDRDDDEGGRVEPVALDRVGGRPPAVVGGESD